MRKLFLALFIAPPLPVISSSQRVYPIFPPLSNRQIDMRTAANNLKRVWQFEARSSG